MTVKKEPVPGKANQGSEEKSAEDKKGIPPAAREKGKHSATSEENALRKKGENTQEK